MESFITRCNHCRCRLRIPATDKGKPKQTVRCSRCQTVQSVSSPPGDSLASAQQAPPRLRPTWEQKAVWLLLPVTAWLAWNELGRTRRPIEENADNVGTHVKSSPGPRLPSRVWQDLES